MAWGRASRTTDQPQHTVGEFRIQGAGRLIRQDEPGMMHGARRD